MRNPIRSRSLNYMTSLGIMPDTRFVPLPYPRVKICFESDVRRVSPPMILHVYVPIGMCLV